MRTQSGDNEITHSAKLTDRFGNTIQSEVQAKNDLDDYLKNRLLAHFGDLSDIEYIRSRRLEGRLTPDHYEFERFLKSILLDHFAIRERTERDGRSTRYSREKRLVIFTELVVDLCLLPTPTLSAVTKVMTKHLGHHPRMKAISVRVMLNLTGLDGWYSL